MGTGPERVNSWSTASKSSTDFPSAQSSSPYKRLLVEVSMKKKWSNAYIVSSKCGYIATKIPKQTFSIRACQRDLEIFF